LKSEAFDETEAEAETDVADSVEISPFSSPPTLDKNKLDRLSQKRFLG